MRGTLIYAPGDVRSEIRDAPKIIDATDAVIRVTATCVCGSDLWDYRGINKITQPTPMGHEYVGIDEESSAMLSATGCTIAPVSANRSRQPPIRGRSRSMSRLSTSGCSSTYNCASVDLPMPGGPLRWIRRGTPGVYPGRRPGT